MQTWQLGGLSLRLLNGEGLGRLRPPSQHLGWGPGQVGTLCLLVGDENRFNAILILVTQSLRSISGLTSGCGRRLATGRSDSAFTQHLAPQL